MPRRGHKDGILRKPFFQGARYCSMMSPKVWLSLIFERKRIEKIAKR